MDICEKLSARASRLEATLLGVRLIIASDSVEYDDISNAIQQIDAALMEGKR
jgi:hypothetical protein